MSKHLRPIAIGLLVVGCAGLTEEQKKPAHYGMFPDNYEQIVKDYFRETLIDPESGRYRFFGKPYRGYTIKGWIYGGGPDKFGYAVDVGVNAKNRFGGYVGEKLNTVLIRNNVVIYVHEAGDVLPVYRVE